MGWQAVITISIFAEVAGRLMQRSILKDDKSDPIASAVVFQFLAGIIIGIYAIYHGFFIPDLRPIAINLLLMPVLYGVANILIFKSLKLTEASIFTVLFASRALWLILGAIFLLHEVFAPMQFIGSFFIIAGVILVSWKKSFIKFSKGELYAILAGVFFSFAIINDSFIVKTFDVVTYNAVSFIFPALFILIVNYPKTPEVVSLLFSRRVGKISLLSGIYGVSSVMYFTAYVLGNNAAQLGAIFQVSSVLTVLFAIFILNEKSKLLVKILAAVVSFVGVLLVG